MSRKPHTQLHLPPLDPDEALIVVNVFERLISAIWRAHGPQMVLSLQRKDEPPPVASGRIGSATVDNPFDADPVDPDPEIPF